MTRRIKIASAQPNVQVGNITSNVDEIIRMANAARDELDADVVVFPELTVTGYPPEDLLLRDDFLEAAAKGVKRAVDSVNGIVLVFGHPLREDGKLYNAATVSYDGRVVIRYRKQDLPNYLVFDEKRYFDLSLIHI